MAVEGGDRGGDLLLLDSKVGSPYVTSLTVEERVRSAAAPRTWRSAARRSDTSRQCSGGRSAASPRRRAARLRPRRLLRVRQEGQLSRRAAAGGGGAAHHPRD
eukprot:3935202-Prymnesium_polylepis.1